MRKRILFLSPGGGNGKSTAAWVIANMLAVEGKSVLINDLNFGILKSIGEKNCEENKYNFDYFCPETFYRTPRTKFRKMNGEEIPTIGDIFIFEKSKFRKIESINFQEGEKELGIDFSIIDASYENIYRNKYYFLDLLYEMKNTKLFMFLNQTEICFNNLIDFMETYMIKGEEASRYPDSHKNLKDNLVFVVKTFSDKYFKSYSEKLKKIWDVPIIKLDFTHDNYFNSEFNFYKMDHKICYYVYEDLFKSIVSD